jgi:hypothetical protein
MQKKNFNLGLLGKKYKDKTYIFDKFKISETNEPVKIIKSLGGIYNFKKIKNKNLKFNYFEDGETKATIISDLNSSTRTSILENTKSFDLQDINYSCIDWLHVSYLDDISYLKFNFKTPTSVDFCKNGNREKHLDILKKCSLIFDSRERKHLYKNIKIKTPIIFHDPQGCECIINNEISKSYSLLPIKNVNVNGLGDIFAGIFIEKFYNIGLDYAINYTSHEVKNYLIKCQNTIF